MAVALAEEALDAALEFLGGTAGNERFLGREHQARAWCVGLAGGHGLDGCTNGNTFSAVRSQRRRAPPCNAWLPVWPGHGAPVDSREICRYK
ncbi:hypothetical protein TBR22_A09470 [Luteitalea sp. TBR-22]|nr:hypothetical protein TBR22_A09470 [Luteitalea sp. TBR-22]